MWAPNLAGRGGTDDALVAVVIGGVERGELEAGELGETRLVSRGLIFGRPPLERPEVQERLGGGRTEQGAVGGDRPLEGAVAAPVRGVQVHHEAGSGAPQRCGEGLGMAVGVSAVGQHIAEGDPVVMEAHQHLGHGAGGVDARSVQGDAPDQFWDTGTALVAHHGGDLGVVPEEQVVLGSRRVALGVAEGGIGVIGRLGVLGRPGPAPGLMIGPVDGE